MDPENAAREVKKDVASLCVFTCSVPTTQEHPTVLQKPKRKCHCSFTLINPPTV